MSCLNLPGQETMILQDQVIMLDGTIYKGKIIETNGEEITLQPVKGSPLSIRKSGINKYYQYFEDDDSYVWINKEQQANRVQQRTIELPSSLGRVRVKEFGLNLSSFVTQFVPFGRSSTASGPYNVTMRFGKGNHLFHLQFGVDAVFQNGFSDTGHVNIGIGYMNKHQINNKFSYYNFYDLMAFSGSFNEPGNSGNDLSDNGGLGVGIGFGIEYELHKNIRMGTETILYLGSPNIDFVAPVALYLIARFER